MAADPAPRHAVPDRLDSGLVAGIDRAARPIDIGGETMGTRWSARMALPAGLDAAPLAVLVQSRLDGIVAQMSHWDATSLLGRYNMAPAGSWTALPSDFGRVIAGALEVAEASGGAFDPALGRLTDLWGLGPRPAAGPPSEAEIGATLAHCGWRRLAFDANAGRLRQPGGLWLDLSGIAKGYAADAVADALATAGIGHALVEIGGECAGRGIRPDGDPWWVELESPPGFRLPRLRIALHQLAVATSGDYLAGAHALDPRTGRPATHGATAVSVIHESCMLADAWASALSVLPPAEARLMADRQGLAARLLSRDGGEWLSAALRRML